DPDPALGQRAPDRLRRAYSLPSYPELTGVSAILLDVPARIVVDEAVPVEKRTSIVEAVRGALKGKSDDDAVIAVVTRLPSGRLHVFVNHVEDPTFVSALEAALAQL